MNRNNDNNGKCREFPVIFPPQHLNRYLGFEYVVNPRPMFECNYNCRKLENKVVHIMSGRYSALSCLSVLILWFIFIGLIPFTQFIFHYT